MKKLKLLSFLTAMLCLPGIAKAEDVLVYSTKNKEEGAPHYSDWEFNTAATDTWTNVGAYFDGCLTLAKYVIEKDNLITSPAIPLSANKTYYISLTTSPYGGIGTIKITGAKAGSELDKIAIKSYADTEGTAPEYLDDQIGSFNVSENANYQFAISLMECSAQYFDLGDFEIYETDYNPDALVLGEGSGEPFVSEILYDTNNEDSSFSNDWSSFLVGGNSAWTLNNKDAKWRLSANNDQDNADVLYLNSSVSLKNGEKYVIKFDSQFQNYNDNTFDLYFVVSKIVPGAPNSYRYFQNEIVANSAKNISSNVFSVKSGGDYYIGIKVQPRGAVYQRNNTITISNFNISTSEYDATVTIDNSYAVEASFDLNVSEQSVYTIDGTSESYPSVSFTYPGYKLAYTGNDNLYASLSSLTGATVNLAENNFGLTDDIATLQNVAEYITNATRYTLNVPDGLFSLVFGSEDNPIYIPLNGAEKQFTVNFATPQFSITAPGEALDLDDESVVTLTMTSNAGDALTYTGNALNCATLTKPDNTVVQLSSESFNAMGKTVTISGLEDYLTLEGEYTLTIPNGLYSITIGSAYVSVAGAQCSFKVASTAILNVPAVWDADNILSGWKSDENWSDSGMDTYIVYAPKADNHDARLESRKKVNLGAGDYVISINYYNTKGDNTNYENLKAYLVNATSETEILSAELPITGWSDKTCYAAFRLLDSEAGEYKVVICDNTSKANYKDIINTEEEVYPASFEITSVAIKAKAALDEGTEFDVNNEWYSVMENTSNVEYLYVDSEYPVKEVEIPQTVSVAGTTYNVVGIADGAFKDNKDVESVIIPASIKSIGANAFDGCNATVFADFADGDVTVASNAFAAGTTVYVHPDLKSSYSFAKGANMVFGHESAKTIHDGYPYYCFNENGLPNVEMTYKRNFTLAENAEEGTWQALFVPHAVNVENLGGTVAELKRVYVENGRRYVEWGVVEEGTTLDANKPYIYKPGKSGEHVFTGRGAVHHDDATNRTVSVTEEFRSFGITLTGVYAPMDVKIGDGNYYLYADGNFKMAGKNSILKPFRVFLTIQNNEPQMATTLYNVLDNGTDTPTAIGVLPFDVLESGVYYDLQGNKVVNPEQGIYILNGKKVVIK